MQDCCLAVIVAWADLGWIEELRELEERGMLVVGREAVDFGGATEDIGVGEGVTEDMGEDD